MASYVKNLMGYGDLNVAEFKPLFKPEIVTPIERRYFRDWDHLDEAYYGMGWRIVVNQQDTVYYHGGFVNNFRSEIAMRPCDGLGVVFLFNEFTLSPKLPYLNSGVCPTATVSLSSHGRCPSQNPEISDPAKVLLLQPCKVLTR